MKKSEIALAKLVGVSKFTTKAAVITSIGLAHAGASIVVDVKQIEQKRQVLASFGEGIQKK